MEQRFLERELKRLAPLYPGRKGGKAMTEKRKLVNFTCPNRWEKDGKYHISFAYYDGNDQWTGKSEGVELTESELYHLLRPFLVERTKLLKEEL